MPASSARATPESPAALVLRASSASSSSVAERPAPEPQRITLADPGARRGGRGAIPRGLLKSRPRELLRPCLGKLADPQEEIMARALLSPEGKVVEVHLVPASYDRGELADCVRRALVGRDLGDGAQATQTILVAWPTPRPSAR